MTRVRPKRKHDNSKKNENQSPSEGPSGSQASFDAPDGCQAPRIDNKDHTELSPLIRNYLTSFSDREDKTYPHQNYASVHDSEKDVNDGKRRENFSKSQLSQKQKEIDQEPPSKRSRKAIANGQSLEDGTSSHCTAGTVVRDSYPGVSTSKGSLRPGESSSSVAIMTPGIENGTADCCIGTGVNESYLDSSSTMGSSKGIPRPGESIEHATIDTCQSSDNGERQPLFDLNRASYEGEERPLFDLNLSSNDGEMMPLFDLNVSPESDHGEMRQEFDLNLSSGDGEMWPVFDLNLSYDHGEMRPSFDLNLSPDDNFNESEVEETRPLLDLNRSDNGEIRPLLFDLNQSDDGEIQPLLFDLNQADDGEIQPLVFDLNQSDDGETQQTFDLNVPHVLPDSFEYSFQSIHQNDQISNSEAWSTQQQSNPPLPVRRSKRSRPPTARALEAIADGYLAGNSRRRHVQRNAAISDMESSPGPS